MRYTARTLVVVLLVVGLVAAVPAAASAAPLAPASAPTATVPNFDPSANKWRAWMVNLLSSVMGAATPSKYRAEQIANLYYYKGGFETLNAQLGIDGVRVNSSGVMTGVRWVDKNTGTYTDVVIAGLEEKYKQASAVGNGPVRAPLTKAQKFMKVVGGVGGVLGVYTAYELSAVITGQVVDAVGEAFFGFDAQGAVCAGAGVEQGDELGATMVSIISGQDCSAWGLDPEYIVNGDGGVTYGTLTYGGLTLSFVSATYGAGWPLFCYSGSGNTPGNTDAYMWSGSTPTRVANSPASGTNLFNWGNGHIWGCPVGADSGVIQNGVTSPAIWFVPNGAGPLPPDDPGVVAKLPELALDPERRLDCTVTYTDATALTASSDTYFESDGEVAEPVCPETPAGKTPDDVRVDENLNTAPAGPGTGSKELYDEPVTDEYKEWWEEYPECQYGGCALDLYKLDTVPLTSCFDVEAGCPDWFDDPEKVDNYQCRYGVHIVDLAECNVYSGLFQPGRVETGSPYSDPSTGSWSGAQTAPAPGKTSMNQPIQDPEEPRSCQFPAFALDPVSWVLTPINCALERAFVPRRTVVEVNAIATETAWNASAPGQLATAVGAVGPALGTLGAGGCGGIIVPAPKVGAGGAVATENVALLPACPGDFFAPWAPVFSWLITGSLVVGGFFGIKRQLDKLVGNS